MRIVLLAAGDATDNPRTIALAASLDSVGHEVTIVCGGPPSTESGMLRVPTRVPVGGGALGGLARRAQPAAMRHRSFRRRLAAAAEVLQPHLVYATTAAVLPVAVAVADVTGAAVVHDPRHPDAGNVDVVHRAPHHIEFATAPAGPGLAFHTPADVRGSWEPRPGRHRGTSIVIAYRQTATTPARYLHSALVRAGIEVQHAQDRLDWMAIDPGTAAVVFVESPYPALEVAGTNPGVPVLLWAHHGEHHTDAHLRLIARYGVDAILLAHSWHLAHRYPVPVHRFPFAVAPELLDGSAPWAERRYDVAFVGSTTGEGPYGARRQIIGDLDAVHPADRRSIVEGVTPDRMAEMYGAAKVVFNDGGTRHHPITMRVFETIGSGAALLTTDAPGLDLLFTPDEHYRSMQPEEAASAVAAMLANPATAQMAAAALDHALGRHTYDHRVDELLAIAEATTRTESWAAARPASEVARAVADDVEVSTVAAYGLPDLAEELPLHAVWTDPEPGARGYDAVALGAGWHGPIETARGDAVRYVYIEPGAPMKGEAQPFPSDIELTRIDLHAPGYRIAEDAP
jgi:hypothetical protein